jgi:general secretion pathway protein J
MVVVVFGSLRVGARAWEKGERNVESNQRYRAVLELIQSQLNSIVTRQIIFQGKTPLQFKGDGETMEFVSHTALVPGNDFGMVYVRYAVVPGEGEETVTLKFWEKNFVFLDEKTDFENLAPEDFTDLIAGLHQVTFEFLKDAPESEDAAWQSSWDSEEEKGLPRAVRVALVRAAETPPVRVICRLRAVLSP